MWFFKRNNKKDSADSENDYFESLRKKEYPNLDQQGHVYFDFTGGNLYPKSLIDSHYRFLAENVLGNPHSTNPSSMNATKYVDEARFAISKFFNADEYECIFTANASGALKIIGESYPFDSKSTYIYTFDNHNSVNGIRDFCHGKGGHVEFAKLRYDDLTLDDSYLLSIFDKADKNANNLFAFPAQSNASGVKHDLKWVEIAQKKGFDVLLDVAAYVPTSKLDLARIKPNFASMSFYKIFGYPTGIGCLFIRKDTFKKLLKPWFAGGTVSFVSIFGEKTILVNNHEKFEDGTLNYAGIPALKTGLEYIESIGMERINKRIATLLKKFYHELLDLKHSNGKPIVRIFGPSNLAVRGGNMLLNFFDKNDRVIPFYIVEKKANERLISIRTGCFCNPGIDEINTGITEEDMHKYFTPRDKKEDYYFMFAELEKMRGAIRVSIGIPTNYNDISAFIDLALAFKDM